jgi:excisionase family DNA binding protein
VALGALYYAFQTEPLHLPGFALAGLRFFCHVPFGIHKAVRCRSKEVTYILGDEAGGAQAGFRLPKKRLDRETALILTAQEVAAMLRISKRQAYELSKENENPIPSIRIRTSVRFRKSDVNGWIELVPLKTDEAPAPPYELSSGDCMIEHV